VVVRANVYARVLTADMKIIVTALAARKHALPSYFNLIVRWNNVRFLMEGRIDDLERFFYAARYAASYLVPGLNDERRVRDCDTLRMDGGLGPMPDGPIGRYDIDV
jgi:hypothetical protein